MTAYPLVTSYGGVGYQLVLDNVVLATALEFPPESICEVTVEPDNRIQGWKIRSSDGILGWLDAEESAEYPALGRLRAQGMSAATTACITLDEVVLDIGLPEWHIPRNNQSEGTVLLAGGHPCPIDTSTSADIDSDFLDSLSAASYFVCLKQAGSDIVVLLDSRVVGTLGPIEAFPVVAQVLSQTPVSALLLAADGQVVLDLPADPDHVFAPLAPSLLAPSDAGTAPATPAEQQDEFDLTFDPCAFTLPPHRVGESG
ncbi:MAG: hypothetical protein SOW59_07120 [Corynebacterium sp.]|nr:hypothetical protein [Corynebacterium sp.]